MKYEKVRIKEQEFWMEAESDNSPVVLSPDQVNFGQESYAHCFGEVGILRYGQKIAEASDIKRLGIFEEVSPWSKFL